MKYFFLSFLLFFISLFALPQAKVQSMNRVEILLDGYSSAARYIRLLSAGKDGLVVFQRGEKINEKEDRNWHFVFYDTNFKKVAETDCPVDKNLTFQAQYLDTLNTQRRAFLFFQGSLNDGKNLVIVDFKTRTVSRRAFDPPGRTGDYLVVSSFNVHGDVVYLEGHRAALFSPGMIKVYNLTTNSLTEQFLDKKEDVRDLCIRVNEGLVDAVSLKQEEETQQVAVYSYQGSEHKKTAVAIPTGRQDERLGPLSLKAKGNEHFIMGVFSRSKTASIFLDNTLNAQGFYIGKISGNKLDFIKYHHFADFKNFFNYLSGDKREKAEREADEKKKDGGRMKLDFSLQFDEAIEWNNQYVLIAEAYKSLKDSKGNTIGYNTLHAVAAGFDKEGNLLWDACFDFEDIVKMRSELYASVEDAIVKIHADNDNLKLMLPKSDAIYTKTIDKSTLADEKETKTEAAVYYNGDEVKSGDANGEYWYDNYFLRYGEQRLWNTKTKQNRIVFYLEKVKY